MGRPQEPLDPSGGPVVRLAQALRLLRERARLTYGEMEAKSRTSAKPYTRSTFSRAANGVTVPSADVVAEYTRICGGDTAMVAAMEKLRVAARRTRYRPGPSRTSREARYPWAVENRHDLLSLMKSQRLAAGQPALRDIVHRAAAHGARIRRSTLHDVLSGRRLPARELLLAFALACGVAKTDIRDWDEAWMRVVAKEKNLPLPAPVARKAHKRLTPSIFTTEITKALEVLQEALKASTAHTLLDPMHHLEYNGRALQAAARRRQLQETA